MRVACPAVLPILAWIAAGAACSEDVLLAELDAGAADSDADTDADGDADTDADGDADADSDTDTAACSWHTAQLGLLSSVWGAGPSEVYAVGGSTITDSLAFRFDGADWQALPDPPLLVETALMDVWGFPGGSVVTITDSLQALHWNGLSWTVTSTWSAIESLRGVWGPAANDVWAVGGILNTVVMRYQGGGSWAKIPTEELPAVGPLAAIWGDGPDGIAAVGAGAILLWDGQQWSLADTGQIVDSFLMIFENAWGASIEDLWVVGQHGLTFEGVALHRDGGAWAQADLGPAAEGAALRGVHGSGPDDVWIVGERDGEGVVLRLEDGAWGEVEGPFSFPLNEVWVAAPDRVFAVGESGAVWCD